jgi:hypothetical protein
VRIAPVLSLVMTLGWVALGYWLSQRPKTKLLGDLLLGFALSWWCGSMYWGWLRIDPVLHLPVEALGFPLAWLARKSFPVGSYFFAGSFVGTALTDAYIWAVGLTPWWVQLMQDERPQNMSLAMTGALTQMHSLPGVLWAIVISAVLLIIGLVALRWRTPHTWAFAGAVLNTLFVNALFWAGAMIVAVFRPTVPEKPRGGSAPYLG